MKLQCLAPTEPKPPSPLPRPEGERVTAVRRAGASGGWAVYSLSLRHLGRK